MITITSVVVFICGCAPTEIYNRMQCVGAVCLCVFAIMTTKQNINYLLGQLSVGGCSDRHHSAQTFRREHLQRHTKTE